MLSWSIDAAGWLRKKPGGNQAGLLRGKETSSDFASAVRTGQTDQVVSVGHGLAAARVVSYTGDGKGIWKPIRAVPGARGYCHDGNSEVAAYRLGELLQEPVVPETVFDQDHQGTSQRFIEQARIAASVPPAEQYELLGRQEDRVYTIVALDFIVGNGDRHPGNFLFDEQGQLWAVDHGHATWQEFGTGVLRQQSLSRNYLLMWYLGQEPPPERSMKHGIVVFPPHLVERWKKITHEQFEQAFADVSQEGRVRSEAAWQNLQKIVQKEGWIEW